MLSQKRSYFQLNVTFTSLKTLSLLLSIYSVVAIAEICLVTLIILIGNWALLNNNPAIFNWLNNPIISWYENNAALFDSLFWAAVVVFLIWFYQAYRNLYALDQETDTTPGGVIGECLVPIVNLRGPYINMREIWQKVVDPTNWRIIKTWWGALILGSLAYYIAITLHTSASFQLSTIQDIQLISIATFFYTVCSFCFIAFIMLQLKIVQTISATQEQRLAQLPSTKADHSQATLPGTESNGKAGLASKIMLGTVIAVVIAIALFIIALAIGGAAGWIALMCNMSLHFK